MYRTQVILTYKGSLHIFTYNYIFHPPASNNVFIIITFYNKQWEKKGYVKLYNILSSIYVYVIIHNCHIRGKRYNNGGKVNTIGNN